MLKKLRRDIADTRQSLGRVMQEEHREIKANLHFMKKTFEEMTSLFKEIEKEIAELREANQSLSSECTALRKQVCENYYRITLLEQYYRKQKPRHQESSLCQ